MTEEDAEFFRRMGFSGVQASPSKRKRPKQNGHKLVYELGGKVKETICRGQYGLCVQQKNLRKHNPSYRSGVLNIVPNV